MFLVEKGKELLQLIRAVNPWALLFWTIYVCGVLALIYALMQVVHGVETKDKASMRRAMIGFAVALVLIIVKLLAYRLGWFGLS